MTCTADQLAEMLGLTRTRVLQLARENVVIKMNPLEYAVVESVKNYISTLKIAPVIEGVPSIDESKARKEFALAGLAELKLQEGKMEVVSIAEVDERDAKIGSVVRAAIIKQRSELPPQLEGLNAARMVGVFDDYNTALLEEMADHQSEFWSKQEKANIEL